MSGTIFLVQPHGTLVEMRESLYDSEATLQTLLAAHPDLLAGNQMDDANPRRWLLVKREAGVRDESEGSERWSLDHLFLDQDAIPTFVEVKRSTDTRIRREVVGQMLDYAANGVAYWPVGQLREWFERGCVARGVNADDVLTTLLGPDADSARFWQQVDVNLAAGRIRLVFVADTIPPALRRVVEFLNGQMSLAEVLALEIKQFVGQGVTTLVPRVIGQTEAAQQKKAGSSPPTAIRQWGEDTFFPALAARGGDRDAATAHRMYVWAQSYFPRIWWGKGKEIGSFFPAGDWGNVSFSSFGVYTTGDVEIAFQYMRRRRPFDDETKRLELLRRLNAIPGVTLAVERVALRPSFPVRLLADNDAFATFCAAFEWCIGEVQAASLTDEANAP